MTYPQTLGYQRDSATSKEAAQVCTSAATAEAKILAYLSNNSGGIIGDEVAMLLDTQTGTAAARLRGLELKGKIVKTESTRLTRFGRKAFVYQLKQ